MSPGDVASPSFAFLFGVWGSIVLFLCLQKRVKHVSNMYQTHQNNNIYVKIVLSMLIFVVNLVLVRLRFRGRHGAVSHSFQNRLRLSPTPRHSKLYNIYKKLNYCQNVRFVTILHVLTSKIVKICTLFP